VFETVLNQPSLSAILLLVFFQWPQPLRPGAVFFRIPRFEVLLTLSPAVCSSELLPLSWLICKQAFLSPLLGSPEHHQRSLTSNSREEPPTSAFLPSRKLSHPDMFLFGSLPVSRYNFPLSSQTQRRSSSSFSCNPSEIFLKDR